MKTWNHRPHWVLIISMNLILFGVTPFLNCGGGPDNEPIVDAGPPPTRRVSPEPVVTPDVPTVADVDNGPKANTPYTPPKDATTPTDAFAIKAANFEVAPGDEKRICFVMDAPNKEDRFLNRFEPLVANNGLVSQMILSLEEGAIKEPWDCSDEDYSQLKHLYVWMKGAGPFQFPTKSGVLLRSGKKLRLTLRVKNTTLQAIQAASGIKIFHIPFDGTNYKLWSHVLTEGLKLPAGRSDTKGNICVLKEPVTLLAGMPLLGQQGTQFITELVRADGSREELVFLQSWSPSAHMKVYAFPHKAAKGDTLATTCSWRNTSKDEVQAGWKSTDETCGLLAYIDASSAETKDLCDENGQGPAYTPPPIDYKGGECAPKDGLTSAKDISVTTKLSAELDASFGFDGGDWPDAKWELTQAEVTFSAALIGNLLQKEYTMAAGQLRTGEGKFSMDFVIQAVVSLGEKTYPYPFPVTVSGSFKKGAKPGEFSVDVSCGEFQHEKMTYKIESSVYEGTTMWIGGIITAKTQAGVISYAVKLRFKKQD